MAAALGIHESTIKVAMVYEGSVIVQFTILEESDDEQEKNNLAKILKTLEQKIGSKTLDMGVEVISGSVGDVQVDPDYWKLEEEKDDEIMVDEEEEEENEKKVIVVKQSGLPKDENKTMAIIIIVSAIVITGALLIAAYFFLKHKFVNRVEEIRRVNQGVQEAQDIQVVGHVEK